MCPWFCLVSALWDAPFWENRHQYAVVYLFQDVVFADQPGYGGDPLLAALFAGITWGGALALLYMRGSSSGGTDFLTMSIKVLRPHLSVGVVTGAIDLVVILLGWPVFGSVDAVLYGLVTTAVTSLVIDKLCTAAMPAKC